MKKFFIIFVAILLCFFVSACENKSNASSVQSKSEATVMSEQISSIKETPEKTKKNIENEKDGIDNSSEIQSSEFVPSVSRVSTPTRKEEVQNSDKHFLTKLYSNVKTNTNAEKMNLINARFERRKNLLSPTKIEAFYNDNYCLYAVLEYTEKDYKKMVSEGIISNKFDCYVERNEELYSDPEYFDPIWRPLEKQPWWKISIENKNVVLSDSKSFDLNYAKGATNIITVPRSINTVVYFEKCENDVYKAYCALESWAIRDMQENGTLSQYIFGD